MCQILKFFVTTNYNEITKFVFINYKILQYIFKTKLFNSNLLLKSYFFFLIVTCTIYLILYYKCSTYGSSYHGLTINIFLMYIAFLLNWLTMLIAASLYMT